METFKEFIRSVIVAILTWEARAILAKYRPSIITVTGSVGKTSTKDAVYAALSRSFFVRKSEKSFNSDIGVPLTILGVPNGWSNPIQWMKNIVEGLSLLFLKAPYPEWLVLEVGADRPGDITKSLSWLTPDIVVGTRFPEVPVHVEFYRTPEDVRKEETSLLHRVASKGGVVLSVDDSYSSSVPLPEGVRAISYGFAQNAHLHASRYMVTTKSKIPTGIAFDISYKGEKVRISLPGVLGKTHAQAVMAGIATALMAGVTLQKAAEGFVLYEPPPGRTRIISGTRGILIIDDTYNASPAAVEEALHILADIPHAQRRIAILADMLELGSHSVPEHRKIGRLIPESADVLITVGVRARDIAHGAQEAGMLSEQIITYDRGSDAASALISIIAEGDVLLVKGSQSMRMERVVKSLMAEPVRAKELLVRQDAEWMIR